MANHVRSQDFQRHTGREKIRISLVAKKQMLAILTFISLAFRSLDWVQVIHEGLFYEKRGRGKIDEEIYFQESVL